MWSYGADDTATYRAGYIGRREDESQDRNLRWFRGEIYSAPGRLSIFDFAPDGPLRGDYEFLEDDHSYVQWLFPIREQGLNPQAQPLMLHEATAIAEDKELQQRALDNYECMLDFYGMQLLSRETGEVARTEPASHCAERYANLRMYSHNNLRITRMLKFLGEVGLERLKKGFLSHAVHEIYVTKELRRCRASCRDYWAGTLRDDSERAELGEQVARYEAECQDDDEDYWKSSDVQMMWWGDSDDDWEYEDSSDDASMQVIRPSGPSPPPGPAYDSSDDASMQIRPYVPSPPPGPAYEDSSALTVEKPGNYI